MYNKEVGVIKIKHTKMLIKTNQKDKHGKDLYQNALTGEEKQEIRVRHWNRLTDEQEDGTVIKEEEIYYLVVPDYDVSVKMHWKKRDCDVINGEGVG